MSLVFKCLAGMVCKVTIAGFMLVVWVNHANDDFFVIGTTRTNFHHSRFGLNPKAIALKYESRFSIQCFAFGGRV
jgi:hypothetical protein